MSPSSVAGIITAIATVITATGGLVVAVTLLLPTLRRIKATQVGVAEVHTLVNQTHDDNASRMSQLEDALRAAGVPIPKDPAVKV